MSGAGAPETVKAETVGAEPVRAARCSVAGCPRYEAFGFTFPDGTVQHACTDPAHRAEIAEAWEEARRRQAAEIAAKMKPAQGSLW